MLFVPDPGVATLASADQIAKINHVVQNPAVVRQLGEIQLRHRRSGRSGVFQKTVFCSLRRRRRLSAAETDGGKGLARVGRGISLSIPYKGDIYILPVLIYITSEVDRERGPLPTLATQRETVLQIKSQSRFAGGQGWSGFYPENSLRTPSRPNWNHCAANCVIVCTTMRTEIRSDNEKRHATIDSPPMTSNAVEGKRNVGCTRANGLKKCPSTAAV